MDPRYVRLEDQTSYTGDKAALAFLPKDIQAVAMRSIRTPAPTDSMVVTPSSDLTSDEAGLLAKAALASGLSTANLFELLQKQYQSKRVESSKLIPQFSGLGQSDLLQKLAAGTAVVTSGIDLAQKLADPEAAKAAEEAKAAESQASNIKMIAGVAVLGAIAYFFFFKKSAPKTRKKTRKKRRKRRK